MPSTGKTSTGKTSTSDTRVVGYEPLLSPAALLDELPLTDAATGTVEQTRADVRAVLDGSDDRLLVITGPCSVHDPAAALDYAGRLRAVRDQSQADLLIVMRVYFEKPRTVTGWKGLINDPGMDGRHDVHRGLRTARRLLLDIVGLGLPVGCEWLDPITPQYIADTVTWGAIGARTTESQTHRQLASGLSMPIGFKNGTDGDVQVAIDACRASATGHTFFGVTMNGAAAVVTTAGNPDTHVILRPELRGQPRRQGPGPDHRRGAARPADGGREPRQQRQGPPPPAAGRDRDRRAGGGRGARPERRDARELPAGRQPAAGPAAHPGLRAERHRRVHGLRDHRCCPGQTGRSRPFPTRFFTPNDPGSPPSQPPAAG
jgi:3-deoxy-7-phosphoheptulonate synthase